MFPVFGIHIFPLGIKEQLHTFFQFLSIMGGISLFCKVCQFSISKNSSVFQAPGGPRPNLSLISARRRGAKGVEGYREK